MNEINQEAESKRRARHHLIVEILASLAVVFMLMYAIFLWQNNKLENLLEENLQPSNYIVPASIDESDLEVEYMNE